MDNKIIFDWVAIGFTEQHAATCDLWLIVGNTYTIYMLTDARRELRVIRHQEWSEDAAIASLNAFLKEDRFLQIAYPRVRIGMAEQPFTVVPTDLFEEWETRLYLTQSTDANLLKSVSRAEGIKEYDTQIVYSVRQDTLQLLSAAYPTAKISSNISPFLKAAKHYLQQTNQTKVFVLVRNEQLLVAVLNNEQQLFLNTFSYKSSNDFLYFVMLVYNQLKLDANEIPIVMAGEIAPESEIMNLVGRYIASIEWLKRDKYYTIPKIKLPQCFYIDLFNLYQCEL
jgi:hypothetical protein